MRFPFAWKIAVATSALALLTTGASVYYIFSQARELTLAMMGARLKDIGGAGAYLFTAEDRAALASLRARVLANAPPLTAMPGLAEQANKAESVELLAPEFSAALMATPEFQRTVQHLRMVREGTTREVKPLHPLLTIHEMRKAALQQYPDGDIPEGALPSITYTYLYMAAPGYEKTGEYIIYLADGDYRPYDWDGDGKFDGENDNAGNPIGNMVPSPNPEMSRALVDGAPYATPDWSEDPWGVWVAGFVPIKNDAGDVIAVLGMDYDVRSDANKVAFIRNICIAVVVVAFLLAIGLAILMARYLDRPISKLREGAERVANRDFSAHIQVKNRDELGLLANAFNNMVTEIRQYAENMEELNSAFERFVPKEFLQHMGIENIVGVRLGDQVQREMTVLFSDIRSFTTLSESMTPKENFDFLNGYLGRVSPLIRSHNGFVDKFIGDAIMALFPRRADDAVENSIEMLSTVEDYNSKRARHGYPPIRIGIGLHTGNLMLGTIGEERRMEGTVISDAVNLASRLEGLTKKFGASILISEYSLGSLQNRDKVNARCLGRVQVKGKHEPVSVYEIFSADSPEQVELKNRTNAQFLEGLALFQSGKLGAALQVFQEIIRINPLDAAAAAYVHRLEIRRAARAQI